MSATECPSCGFDNRPGALFCGSCGNRLGRPCPACGEVVDPELAFCTACGADLAPSVAPAPSAEERKVVSVLFADLVGSTGRAESADPEDVRRFLDSFHSSLKGELERFGGTVEKYIGDAVMALFGAPRAHEDDPERAVRAALALREAVGELNTADPELQLHVRVGITTGEAVVNLGARPEAGESMAAGDVVNTAARLQSAAPVDGILVDAATRRATESAIDYGGLEAIHPRGKKAAVEVWEVVAPRARLGVDVAFRGGAELVGRQRELDLMLGALARAESERAPQLLTLVGEPGIGKSRLLYELYSRLHADPGRFVLWRQGRSLPYGEGVSFWALGEMVKSQAGILETDTAEATAEKLAEAVEAVLAEPADAGWVLGHLRPLVGLGGEGSRGSDRRDEAFTAWRRFFEALAEQHTLVLVFEDLHWADDGLLDFVDSLVDWVTGVPLFVVCTARPELLERRESWGGGKRNAVTVSLAPLSDEDTGRLVEALLSRRLVRDGRDAELLARAGGNPLYAEEYVRMLVQPGAEKELPLPESVQGIIAARLDALAPDEKGLLQDASVLGKVFWVGELAAVGELERSVVETRLHALERREFVRRERRSSVAGETAYVFRHGLVRDVAYAQIPRLRRAERHQLAAEWIESLAEDRAEDLADMVAYHYLSALQFARASGRDMTALTGRARAALCEAGDRAARLNSFRPAARRYEAALELTAENDVERPSLLFKYGEALFNAHGTGADVLTEAAEALLDAGDRERAAEAGLMLADLLTHAAQPEAAADHLNGAVSLLAERPASRSKAIVLARLAGHHMRTDASEDAIRIGLEAYKMADELELADLHASTLSTIGVARVATGDLEGVRDLERSVAVAEKLNSPELARAYNNLASTIVALGDLPRAYGLYARGRDAAERFGLALTLRFFDAQRMDEAYWRGDWDNGVRLATEFLSSGESRLHDLDAYIVRARIRIARAEEDGALDDSSAAAKAGTAYGDLQYAFPALATRAHVLALAGAPADAAAVVDELLGLWRRHDWRLPGDGLSELARALLMLERGAEFEVAERSARPRTRWLEAAAALAAGDAARAAGVYAEIGSLPDEAYARLLAARALVDAGRESEAAAELEQALAFFRAVGAVAFARPAEELLAGL